MTSRPSKFQSMCLLYLLGVSNSLGSLLNFEVAPQKPTQKWVEQKLDHNSLSMTWHQELLTMTSRPSKFQSMCLLYLQGVSNSLGSLYSYEVAPQKPTQKWVEQKLDHHNSLSMTWHQRYFENLMYYQTGGPVFLKIGGEGIITSNEVSGWHMIELAKKHRAAAFALEHRYYGMSMPENTIVKKTYQYLSSEQALADLAYFIRYIKRVHPQLEKAKVIVFGGSYPGILAAWMRLKYPHLVDGAVASSAPMQLKVDCPEFYETAGESLKRYDPQCEAAIRNATAELKDIMERPGHVQVIQDMFQLNMSSKEVFSLIGLYLAEVVQQDYKRIREVCNNMTMNIAIPPVQRYANVYRHLKPQQTAQNVARSTMNKRSNEHKSKEDVYQWAEDEWRRKFDLECKAAIETATTAIKYMKKENNVKDMQYVSQSDMLRLTSRKDFMLRAQTTGDFIEKQLKEIPEVCNNLMEVYAWTYQRCNELGLMFSFSEKQPFGEGYNLNDKIESTCYMHRINKSQLQSNVKRTNDYYGGRHLNVTRVVFVNGDLDPGYKLGITTDLNPESPAILIKETSHCTDMGTSSHKDPQSLKDARKRIEQEVAKWVEGVSVETNTNISESGMNYHHV